MNEFTTFEGNAIVISVFSVSKCILLDLIPFVCSISSALKLVRFLR
jgi:hypothetical protein